MNLAAIRHLAAVLSVLAAVFTLAEFAIEQGWWRLG